MAVYIDSFNAPYRGMIMCHMIADTREELLVMVDRIGVKRKWIQDFGKYSEHFDICLAKKAKALKLGAIEIYARELVKKMNLKKST
jgi:hypothetical protein